MPRQLVTISETANPVNFEPDTIWVFRYKERNTYPEKDWSGLAFLEQKMK